LKKSGVFKVVGQNVDHEVPIDCSASKKTK